VTAQINYFESVFSILASTFSIEDNLRFTVGSHSPDQKLAAAVFHCIFSLNLTSESGKPRWRLPKPWEKRCATINFEGRPL
jgi:hypothetical protein